MRKNCLNLEESGGRQEWGGEEIPVKLLPWKTTGMTCRGGEGKLPSTLWLVELALNSTDVKTREQERRAHTFNFVCMWESPQANKAPKADGPKCLYPKSNEEQFTVKK